MKNLCLSVLCTLCSLLCTFVGCRESPLLYRAGSDYFPLEEGNSWIYLCKEKNDTIKVKVVKDTVIDRSCWLIIRNGEPEFWYKDEYKVEKLYNYNIFVNGEEYNVAKFWLPWLQIPLVLNNYWNKKFHQQTIILNDTIKIDVEIKCKVSELKSNIYKVDIMMIENLSDTTIYSEFYEPEIGIKKRIVNGIVEELISFSK